MTCRGRNPSPPHDFDYLQNVEIVYLKPSFSLQPHEISIDVFHQNIFAGSTVSDDKTEKKEYLTVPEVSAVKDSRSINEKQNKPQGSIEEAMLIDSHSEGEILFDEERSLKPKEGSEIRSASESRTEHIGSRNVPSDLVQKKVSAPKNLSECDASPKIRGNVESSGIEPLRASKNNSEISVSAQKFFKKEINSDDESWKFKKKDSPTQSSESDFDQQTSTKHVKQCHRCHHKHRNISASEDCDYRAPDSRRSSRKKSHYKHKSSRNHDSDADRSMSGSENSYRASKSRKSSKKKHHKHKRYRKHHCDRSLSGSENSDYHVSNSRKSSSKKSRHKHRIKVESDTDTEQNPRSKTLHASSKNSKKEYDAIDSDRSNLKRSLKLDRRRYTYKNENDVSDSDCDCSNYKRSPISERTFDNFQRPVDEYDSSESAYSRENKANQDSYWKDESSHFGPENYYCKVCHLDLNSESTYGSHMLGKRHRKAVNAQSIPQVVLGALSNLSQSKESFCNPSNLKKMKVLNDENAQLQSIVDSFEDGPIPGLQYVKEIRSNKDLQYYCELCDAPCMPVSIMSHLLGFKHQLHCVREISGDFYYLNKDRPKREIEKFVLRLLKQHEQRFGREKITVVETVPSSNLKPSDEAGPSSKIPPTVVKEVVAEKYGPEAVTTLEGMRKDYYCKICDAHMNNINMYKAHIVGKRHLKNEKKTTGERKSQAKGVRAPPNVLSELEKSLLNSDEVIVGLNFIRETRSENGSLYTCYICGSSCTNDMLDHLLGIKHRIRYLESVNEDGSIPNSVNAISQLEVKAYARESLILTECAKIEKEHGRGKVEVYYAKGNPFGV